VILNLAVNARDAMPRGGTLEVEVAPYQAAGGAAGEEVGMRPGRYVLMRVRDTGRGMTDEVKSHCFEPFFTTKPKNVGTGLGLSTCYGIVQQFGGEIRLSSAVGRGTEFRLYFPLAPLNSPAAMIVPRQEVDLPRGTERVLLVEDDETVRDLTARLLTRLGYHIVEAANGAEALAAFERLAGRVDAVITDIVMPRVGGFELARRLRRLRPGIKMIYITGFGLDTLGTPPGHCHEDVILKPFTDETLAVKLRGVLES